MNGPKLDGQEEWPDGACISSEEGIGGADSQPKIPVYYYYLNLLLQPSQQMNRPQQRNDGPLTVFRSVLYSFDKIFSRRRWFGTISVLNLLNYRQKYITHHTKEIISLVGQSERKLHTGLS